jgi:heterotetrameric sarcosine oxidase gamma subunit
MPEAQALIENAPPRALLRLWSSAAPDEIGRVIQDMLGMRLPTAPGSCTFEREVTLSHLAPSQWLVKANLSAKSKLFAHLSNAARQLGGTALDLSAAWPAVVLRSDRLKEILESGCALRMDSRALPVGTMTATRFGTYSVIVHRIADDIAEIHQPRSYARGFTDQLRRVARLALT